MERLRDSKEAGCRTTFWFKVWSSNGSWRASLVCRELGTAEGFPPPRGEDLDLSGSNCFWFSGSDSCLGADKTAAVSGYIFGQIRLTAMSASAEVQTVVCSFNMYLSTLHHTWISLQIYGLRKISNVIQLIAPEKAITSGLFCSSGFGCLFSE